MVPQNTSLSCAEILHTLRGLLGPNFESAILGLAQEIEASRHFLRQLPPLEIDRWSSKTTAETILSDLDKMSQAPLDMKFPKPTGGGEARIAKVGKVQIFFTQRLWDDFLAAPLPVPAGDCVVACFHAMQTSPSATLVLGVAPFDNPVIRYHIEGTPIFVDRELHWA